MQHAIKTYANLGCSRVQEVEMKTEVNTPEMLSGAVIRRVAFTSVSVSIWARGRHGPRIVKLRHQLLERQRGWNFPLQNHFSGFLIGTIGTVPLQTGASPTFFPPVALLDFKF
jgi:hypothetical protein